MLSNRLLKTLEVSKYTERVEVTRKYIMSLLCRNPRIHKTDVINMAKMKHIDISKKVISRILRELEENEYIGSEVDLEDTRRIYIYSLVFDLP